jgi:hypothetical protein
MVLVERFVMRQAPITVELLSFVHQGHMMAREDSHSFVEVILGASYPYSMV